MRDRDVDPSLFVHWGGLIDSEAIALTKAAYENVMEEVLAIDGIFAGQACGKGLQASIHVDAELCRQRHVSMMGGADKERVLSKGGHTSLSSCA